MAILLAGLVVAGAVYLRAPAPGADSEEQFSDSKQHLREMEVYGGTANVLASQLREWFGGLWHGRSLAYTIAVLGLIAAAVAWFALTPLPAPSDEDATPSDTSRGGGGPPR